MRVSSNKLAVSARRLMAVVTVTGVGVLFMLGLVGCKNNPVAPNIEDEKCNAGYSLVGGQCVADEVECGIDEQPTTDGKGCEPLKCGEGKILVPGKGCETDTTGNGNAKIEQALGMIADGGHSVSAISVATGLSANEIIAMLPENLRVLAGLHNDKTVDELEAAQLEASRAEASEMIENGGHSVSAIAAATGLSVADVVELVSAELRNFEGFNNDDTIDAIKAALEAAEAERIKAECIEAGIANDSTLGAIIGDCGAVAADFAKVDPRFVTFWKHVKDTLTISENVARFDTMEEIVLRIEIGACNVRAIMEDTGWTQADIEAFLPEGLVGCPGYSRNTEIMFARQSCIISQ
ncbi:MAG: hypothetical protein FWD33_04145 [Alphaproteobacteria bacterium]|nr:hypothetical protein [Alphaproteobacteria bacterium]